MRMANGLITGMGGIALAYRESSAHQSAAKESEKFSAVNTIYNQAKDQQQ